MQNPAAQPQVDAASAAQAGPVHWDADASDIGLRPGEWPPQLTTSLGNGQPFFRHATHRDPEGDIVDAVYLQAGSGVWLTVYND